MDVGVGSFFDFGLLGWHCCGRFLLDFLATVGFFGLGRFLLDSLATAGLFGLVMVCCCCLAFNHSVLLLLCWTHLLRVPVWAGLMLMHATVWSGGSQLWDSWVSADSVLLLLLIPTASMDLS